MLIQRISETKQVARYLRSRALLKQYLKSKNYILNARFSSADFKLREPKNQGIYYFRINKQYRALAVIIGQELRVFEIDNHS